MVSMYFMLDVDGCVYIGFSSLIVSVLGFLEIFFAGAFTLLLCRRFFNSSVLFADGSAFFLGVYLICFRTTSSCSSPTIITSSSLSSSSSYISFLISYSLFTTGTFSDVILSVISSISVLMPITIES